MFPFIMGLAIVLAELTGIVRDPSGQPVANATIIVVSSATAPLSVRTDDEGRFRLDNLPAGVVDITASAPGLIGEAHRVASDAAGVEISMRVSAITETLVVSASQVDQPLSRVADTVSVIDGREIEARQLAFAAEALTSIPGLAVTRSGGPGTLASVFPRGGESNFTLFLVDGVRVNSFGGGIDLAQLPLGDVDRIEVVRGPQSALHGSDAIGGVVHIITRHGGRPSATGRLETGSRGTARVAASSTGERRGWRWQAGGDYFADDGYTGLAPANGEPVSNDDAEERQGWIGGGYRLTRGTDLQASFRYVGTSRGAPGPFGSDPARRFFGVDRISRGTTDRKAIALRAVQPVGGPSSRVRVRFDVDSADFGLTFKSSFDPDHPSHADTRRTHAHVQADAALADAFSLAGGVDTVTEEERNTYITSAAGETPVHRSVVGTFAEARWNGHERLTVQAGVRAEQIKRRRLDVLGGLVSGDESLLSVNPKIAAAWLVSPTTPGAGARAWTRVRASAGTGIRPPDAFEIAFTDNPALKPERSKSFEAGVTQALEGGTLSLDATAFFNNFDDLIVSVGRLTDVSRYRTDNISNARARGLELSAAWRGGTTTLVRTTYTFMDSEIRAIDSTSQAPAPYHVGDRLLRRPTHQASLDLTWTGQRATAFASVNVRGATLDAEPAYGPSGGLYDNPRHAVVDMGGAWRVLQRGQVEVYARVLNLLDQAYEEVLGYPAPGRTAFVGVRLAAGR